jgi:hypothetical protein
MGGHRLKPGPLISKAHALNHLGSSINSPFLCFVKHLFLSFLPSRLALTEPLSPSTGGEGIYCPHPSSPINICLVWDA